MLQASLCRSTLRLYLEAHLVAMADGGGLVNNLYVLVVAETYILTPSGAREKCTQISGYVCLRVG